MATTAWRAGPDSEAGPSLGAALTRFSVRTTRVPILGGVLLYGARVFRIPVVLTCCHQDDVAALAAGAGAGGALGDVGGRCASRPAPGCAVPPFGRDPLTSPCTRSSLFRAHRWDASCGVGGRQPATHGRQGRGGTRRGRPPASCEAPGGRRGAPPSESERPLDEPLNLQAQPGACSPHRGASYGVVQRRPAAHGRQGRGRRDGGGAREGGAAAAGRRRAVVLHSILTDPSPCTRSTLVCVILLGCLLWRVWAAAGGRRTPGAGRTGVVGRRAALGRRPPLRPHSRPTLSTQGT
jgi:hypothetical protein